MYTLEDRKIGGESMISVRERLRQVTQQAAADVLYLLNFYVLLNSLLLQVISAGKMSSLEDDGFSLLPCEEGQTPCFWCK